MVIFGDLLFIYYYQFLKKLEFDKTKFSRGINLSIQTIEYW